MNSPEDFVIKKNLLKKYKGSGKAAEIPEGVRRIGDSAFEECESLEEIKLPKSVTEIGAYAFLGCSSLKEVEIPVGVKEIKSGVFSGCTSLTEIKLPDTITQIGSSAFENCKCLEAIEIPECVTKIESGAFRKCVNLQKINIPDSVTEIGVETFWGCSSLQKIQIPDKVRKIGQRAFYECVSLQEIKIPDSVTEIADTAFSGCRSLIDSRGFLILNGKLFFCASQERNIAIPDGVKEICPGAFANQTLMESVCIPESVTKIDAGAFKSCTGLKTIEIPDSVGKIGAGAFSGCSSLRTVTLPAHVQFDQNLMFGFPFRGCSSLEQVNASLEVKEALYSMVNERDVFINEHETFTPSFIRDIFSHIRGVGNKKQLLAAFIQADDAGGLQALLDLKYVTTAKIRDELIELASLAGKTESLAVLLTYKERTGNRAKEEKAREKKLERELSASAEELETKAMKEVWSFRFVSLDTKSAYEIRGYKGSGRVVEVPASIGGIPVTKIANNAFSSDKANGESLNRITEFILPDSVREIGNYAFYGCYSLKKVRLPETLDGLGKGAFMNCAHLEAIALPEIRGGLVLEKMFKGCISLKEVHLCGEVKDISEDAFKGCDAVTLYAPSGSGVQRYAEEKEILFAEEG